MVESTPRPGTSADVAVRIAALEQAHQDLERKVDGLVRTQATQATDIALIRQGIEHSRELAKERFDKIESISVVATTKIDSLTSYITSLVSDAQKQAADWKSTPAGRDLQADLTDLREARNEVDDRLASIEKRQYATAIVVSALVIFVNLLAPVVVPLLTGGAGK